LIKFVSKLIVLVALTLAVGACRSGDKPVTTVPPQASASISEAASTEVVGTPESSQTPESPPTPSATLALSATPTGTSTAQPTATPIPHVRLEKGLWLQQIGDCGGARREFAELLGGEGLAADEAEARYRLAQCYLEDGAPAEAAAVLEVLLAEATSDNVFLAPSHFLLGEAYANLGQWSEAEKMYLAYLPLAPELSSLIWQRIGSMRDISDKAELATAAYSEAIESSPDASTTIAMRRNLARLATARGDHDAAIEQYDLIRGNSGTGGLAAEMQWLAGSAMAASGNRVAALQRWQAAIDADERSHYAHAALVALIDAGVKVDEYQRGLVDYYQGLYQLAIEAFDRFLGASPKTHLDDVLYYKGLSELAVGASERGIALLDSLISKHPGSSHYGNAWLAKGQALAKAGQPEAAINSYRELARSQPQSPQAPVALWRAANLETDQGRTADAARSYLEVARKYPSVDEGWRSYQAAGLIYFRQGQMLLAGESWSEMSEAPLAAWTRPVALFWLGRAQAAAGESSAARRSWAAAWEADPSSYYGRRAADWLSGSARLSEVHGGAVQAIDEPSAQVAEVLASWLRGWAGEGTVGLPSSVTGNPDWIRGRTLMGLGLRSQALAAWGRVQSTQSDDAWALAALALHFRDSGAYRLSILSAQRIVALWKDGTMSKAPEPLQRLAYPLPYRPLLDEQGERWKVDVRLLAAVIRQESLFEHAAVSSAGARGLMQIMPATAQGIAQQLGWRGFTADQITLPYVNVTFGAYYLRQNLNMFDSSLAAALAAYNGGPGNTTTWRSWAPEDDDLMVALINFGETRIYVQSVWSHYEEYVRLYPDA